MSLGLIDTSNRRVRPNRDLNRLVNFGSLLKTDPIIINDGDVRATVEEMKKIVREHHGEVAKIADNLYDPRLSRFLKNIFDFVMTYVAYEKDSVFLEQLRTPLRTLNDQRGDCDCMSILIGAILYNKQIPFHFRVTKYDANRDFSHVYVIVPRGSLPVGEGRGGAYYVVDPVIKAFDKEKPFVGKEDYLVDPRLSGFFGLNGLPIQMLNGVGYMSGVDLAGGLYGLYEDVMAVAMGTDLMGFGLGSVEDDEMAMYRHLVRTRDVILAAPQMFRIMKNPLEVARMLDYAIRYWDTPQIDHVLGILENEEQRLLREGVIVYPHADLSGDELGELSLGIFKKVGSAVKKGAKAVAKTTAKVVKATVVAPTKAVAKVTAKAATAVGKGVATAAKATGKAVGKAAKATGKAVATAAKAVGKTVARFNPVSLTARLGLLFAIRTNLFKLADKLQYGLYTEEQAQAAGINIDDFRKMQDSYNNTRKLFVNTLKGKEDKMKQAIAKGVKHKAINGLVGLGEPISGATVAAALGFIKKILSFFKGKIDPLTNKEFLDENITEKQVLDLLNQSEQYDEDGNPLVNTTANPNAEDQDNFWTRAGKVATNMVDTASNVVSTYLPSGGGSSNSFVQTYNPAGNDDDDYSDDYEPINPQNMVISPASGQSSAVTVNTMTGGMMSNISAFLKKNALLVGVGAVGVGAAIYFMTRKKKSANRRSSLSGVTPSRTRKRKPKPKMKSVKLK